MVIILTTMLSVSYVVFSYGEQTLDTVSDLSGVKVALYREGSTPPATDSDCSTALLRLFQWMNASVDILEATDIINGDLVSYDLFAVPGGFMPAYQEDLGYLGTHIIREFVKSGGSYFGVCGGAYFACDNVSWTEDGTNHILEYTLDLFRGQGLGPIVEIADWPFCNMTEITFNQNSSGPILSNQPKTHYIMYYGGPYFEIDNMPEVITIASYAVIDRPAMIALELGQGRVFLSGPHLEFEEDSDRDGCTWDNQFKDPDSEWNLALKIALWLVKPLVSVPSSNLLPTDLMTSVSFSFDTETRDTGSAPGYTLVVFLLSILLVVFLSCRNRTDS